MVNRSARLGSSSTTSTRTGGPSVRSRDEGAGLLVAVTMYRVCHVSGEGCAKSVTNLWTLVSSRARLAHRVLPGCLGTLTPGGSASAGAEEGKDHDVARPGSRTAACCERRPARRGRGPGTVAPRAPGVCTDPSHWAWAPALAPYPPREGQDVAARGYAPPGYADSRVRAPRLRAVVGSSTSPNTADPVDLQPRQWSPRQTLAAVLAALAISAAVSVGVAFADTGYRRPEHSAAPGARRPGRRVRTRAGRLRRGSGFSGLRSPERRCPERHAAKCGAGCWSGIRPEWHRADWRLTGPHRANWRLTEPHRALPTHIR